MSAIVVTLALKQPVRKLQAPISHALSESASVPSLRWIKCELYYAIITVYIVLLVRQFVRFLFKFIESRSSKFIQLVSTDFKDVYLLHLVKGLNVDERIKKQINAILS